MPGNTWITGSYTGTPVSDRGTLGSVTQFAAFSFESQP